MEGELNKKDEEDKGERERRLSKDIWKRERFTLMSVHVIGLCQEEIISEKRNILLLYLKISALPIRGCFGI